LVKGFRDVALFSQTGAGILPQGKDSARGSTTAVNKSLEKG